MQCDNLRFFDFVPKDAAIVQAKILRPKLHRQRRRRALVGGRERARAVKTGMLGTAALAWELAERLSEPPLNRAPLVVDPVLLATSGAPLLDLSGHTPADVLAPLVSRARLVTPNLFELAALTGRDVSTDEAVLRTFPQDRPGACGEVANQCNGLGRRQINIFPGAGKPRFSEQEKGQR